MTPNEAHTLCVSVFVSVGHEIPVVFKELNYQKIMKATENKLFTCTAFCYSYVLIWHTFDKLLRSQPTCNALVGHDA